MGLAAMVKGKRIFMDTAPLIYYIEDSHQPCSKILDMLFEMNSNMQVLLTTSTIALLEVLVIPLKTGNVELAEKYRSLLCQSDTFEMWSIDAEISTKAAELRAKYRLKTPDAIQVAAAICRSSDYFLTNDKQLKVVSELDMLILDELVDNF